MKCIKDGHFRSKIQHWGTPKWLAYDDGTAPTQLLTHLKINLFCSTFTISCRVLLLVENKHRYYCLVIPWPSQARAIGPGSQPAATVGLWVFDQHCEISSVKGWLIRIRFELKLNCEILRIYSKSEPVSRSPVFLLHVVHMKYVSLLLLVPKKKGMSPKCSLTFSKVRWRVVGLQFKWVTCSNRPL